MKNPPPYNENLSEDTNQPAPALWTIVKDRPVLCWDCIHEELIAMGFRTYWPDGQVGTAQFVHMEDNVIDHVSRDGIINRFVDAHILKLGEVDEVPILTEDGESKKFKSKDLIEIFRKNMGNAMAASQLTTLPKYDRPILKDGPDEAYFPFLNCIVKVTHEGIRLLKYAALKDSCVWKSQIIQREYHPHEDPDSCMFSKFINNVSKGETIPARLLAFITAIGYLLHNYTPPSKAKAVIAYDEAKASKGAANGRTGKGVFAEALKQMRNVCIVNGKSWKEDNQFALNDVTSETQIICIDDPNQQFKFEKLFSLITGGLNIARKFLKSLIITLAESPKYLLLSNYYLKATDGSSADRQHVLTFSNFYSKQLKTGSVQPLVDTHGAMFFSHEWDSKEWDAFHNYMLNCVLIYMKQGLKSYTCPSIAMNQIITNTSDDFAEWVETIEIKAGMEIEAETLLNQYKVASDDKDMQPRTFLKYLRNTAHWKGLEIKRTGTGNKVLSFRKVTE